MQKIKRVKYLLLTGKNNLKVKKNNLKDWNHFKKGWLKTSFKNITDNLFEQLPKNSANKHVLSKVSELVITKGIDSKV